jgi:hypothetical protein
VPQEAAVVVDCGGVVSVLVGVDPTDDPNVREVC